MAGTQKQMYTECIPAAVCQTLGRTFGPAGLHSAATAVDSLDHKVVLLQTQGQACSLEPHSCSKLASPIPSAHRRAECNFGGRSPSSCGKTRDRKSTRLNSSH